jgi:hypothetical protein
MTKYYPVIIDGEVTMILATDAEAEATMEILSGFVVPGGAEFVEMLVVEFNSAGYTAEILGIEEQIHLS